MVGTADFNSDGKPDIVWEDPTADAHKVWFMNGTNMTSVAYFQSTGDVRWRVVGVGDFNDDGKGDLLWQHPSYDWAAIWFLNGTSMDHNCSVTPTGDLNWRIVAASAPTGLSKILVWKHSTGLHALWYLNGCSLSSHSLITNSGGAYVTNPDQDFRIVGYWDMSGDQDQSPDLLLRHVTLGIQGIWYLDGGINTACTWALNSAFNEFNTNWRIATQAPTDSTWNLDNVASPGPAEDVPIATVSGGQITVNFPSYYYGSYRAERRVNGGDWQYLTDFTGPQTYVDSQVSSTNAYAYRFGYKDFYGNIVGWSKPAFAAIAAPASLQFDRGRIIILADNTLHTNANSSANFNAALDQLRASLLGAGWRPDGPHYVTRHDDSDPITNLVNQANLPPIRTTVQNLWNSAPTDRPKGIVIVGHVTIPYSGRQASDNHDGEGLGDSVDHRGAWPCDMLYGEMDYNAWTNDLLAQSNSQLPANNNRAGEGKFDADSNPTDLELFVGRIDFARLIAFVPPYGNEFQVEAQLIREYVQKAENYRRKITSYNERGVAHGTFGLFTYEEARNTVSYRQLKHIFEAAYPLGSITHCVGDLFFRNSHNFSSAESPSCLWGFLSGSGTSDSISESVMSPDWLAHTTAQLTAARSDSSYEPRIAFYGLFGSYFMDWNISNDFLRATLAMPNYGVAGVISHTLQSSSGEWDFSAFASGQPLGVALQAGANQVRRMDRMFAVLGDPTLMIRTTSPVTSLNGTNYSDRTVLTWGAGEPDCQYYVFRSASSSGPWTTPIAGPLGSPTHTNYTTQTWSYLVRAAKLLNSGHGSSYWNVSQGSQWPVP